MDGSDVSLAKKELVVVSIVKNEAHHLDTFIKNVRNLTTYQIIVDSGSTDGSKKVAEDLGVVVVEREFIDFGQQWNAAVEIAERLFPNVNFFLKLDPDERLTRKLCEQINRSIRNFDDNPFSGLILRRRLWFLGKPLPIIQEVPRIWVRGRGSFSHLKVNEHLIIHGRSFKLRGMLEHLDSPSLHHWLTKQNKYSSFEVSNYISKKHINKKKSLANFLIYNFPFFSLFVFLFYYFGKGLFLYGRTGYIYSVCRSDVYKYRKFKFLNLLREVAD